MMTIYVSQRPNNDPAPWRPPLGMFIRRSAPLPLDAFDPRPEFDHTRDPEPWQNPDIPEGEEVEGLRYSRPVKFLSGRTRWAPRREQFDVPVNRVLSNLRADYRPSYGLRFWSDFLLSLETGNVEGYSPEEIDHARRVLAKLVAVFS